METFASALRRRRGEQGLSQRQLAESVHYDASLISKVENGREAPSLKFAAAVDDALGAEGALLGLVASPARTLLDPDDEERLLLAARGPSRLDSRVIESLAVMLAEQRLMEDAIGSVPMVGPVTAQLAVVANLVAQARGPLRPRIVRVGAQWAQFRGWLAANTGDHSTADQMYDRALEWAAEASDADMVATALNMKGHLAWLTGRIGAVVGLSAAAARQAARPGVLALAVQQEARGHALMGDGDNCDRRLDEATRLVLRAADRPDDEPPWIYFLSPDFLQLQRGLAYRYLGRHSRAVELIADSLARIPAGMRRTEWVGWYVLQLAMAHAAGHDAAAARDAAAEAAEIAAHTGSQRLAGQVERFLRGLP